MVNEKPIRSFKDLEVYNVSYQAMLDIFKYVLPKLPVEEKFDLTDQLRRSCKAVPRLIAEGYSKRHQKKGFQRYLDDAMAESNESGVSITQARDLYFSGSDDIKILDNLIDVYDKISRQCYNLAVVWNKFDERRLTTKSMNEQANRVSQPQTKN
ncbi:MAG: four helix bundle protein [Planctomycetes bacterium GWF2_42_9]|nr:MAG: four helix bundle protein [Planctomycetes bacterium GWF2_42_9]HAL45097.1 four helix bundle protein [Phycisphaerales bacterium]